MQKQNNDKQTFSIDDIRELAAITQASVLLLDESFHGGLLEVAGAFVAKIVIATIDQLLKNPGAITEYFCNSEPGAGGNTNE